MKRNGQKIATGFFAVVFLFIFSAGMATFAFAADQVVVVNWGGRAAELEKECFYKPFEAETGIRVIMTSPPVVGKIKAQIDSGNIEWDVILTDIPSIVTLTEEGKEYLEPLDYSKFDPKLMTQIIPETKRKYSIGGRIYSFNICYNTNTYRTNHPNSYADVWDLKKFPGVRSLNNSMGGIFPQYEGALMADGVAMDKLYPIDVERAWQSLDRLKPHINKWYKSHSQAVQMLVNGEVDIAITVGPRVIAAKWDGAPVAAVFNQQKLAADNWCILKGTKNLDNAYKLINYILDAKKQACFSSKAPYGPTNMEATKFIKPEIAKDLNTAPENLAVGYWQNVKWWAETDKDGKSNREKAIEKMSKWLME
jgi:putative spermidine/putrescine transport system substrate-binding protein